MAVTILQRPEGYTLGTTAIEGSISSSYGTGDATVYSVAAHGLTDGDYIYLVSDIEDYNGFWYVDSTGTYTFKIKQYQDSEYVQYAQDADVTYYVSTSGHGWSAVHLPITYRLSSDLFPVNSVDTIRNVTSRTDSDGFTALNLSGSLGTIHSYDYLLLETPNAGLSGSYQILEWVSSTVVIINLAYNSGDNFTGATAQKYYNNYNILVRVYAGIRAGHQWESKKPYELATTLQLIPDENGEVFFSVHEILKSYVNTENNTLLSTLPNNIDFWTNFYIEIAESYDDSDGYALGTYTSLYTSDQSAFEGYAVNSMLEFKNIYSGYLSEYIMNNSTAKFLTLFAIPVLFGCTDETPDCYQDISFIKPSSGDYVLNKQYFSNGNAGLLEQDTVSGDEGVYRVPMVANCAYDRVDISLNELQTLLNPTFNGLSPWVILNNSANFSAAYSANTIIFSFLTGGVSGGNDYLTQSFDPVIGYSYTINYNIVITNYVAGNVIITVSFLDASNNLITLGTNSVYTSNGSYSGSLTIQENSQINIDLITKIAFRPVITSSSDGSGPIVTLSELSTDAEFVSSETKQYKIDCGCSAEEIRLTWLNNLGGFDYWNFTANKDLLIEIRETGQVTKPIFPNWPKSYSANADTIRKQTFRDTNKAYTVRSQFMSKDDLDAVAYVKSSVLVQIINSRQDRRTVIVDNESFRVYTDQDKLYSIVFNVSFTNDIPSQTA